jgi:hypothetical protein
MGICKRGGSLMQRRLITAAPLLILSLVSATFALSATNCRATIVELLGLKKPLAIDGDKVVGTAANSGFIYQGGTYTYFAYPNSLQTYPYGVSGDNIVGSVLVNFATNASFLYNGSAFTSLKAPQSTITLPLGISGNNIFGAYGNSKGVHGFIYDGASWTTFDHPATIGKAGSLTGTYVVGMSGNIIAGRYVDTQDIRHGFVYDGTNWTTLADGVIWVNGISDGKVVGGQLLSPDVPGGPTRGFIYDIGTGAYSYPLSLSQLPPGTDSFEFKGLSGNTVIGVYRVPNQATFGFIATIPEPPTFSLAILGGFLLTLIARRVRRRSASVL